MSPFRVTGVATGDSYHQVPSAAVALVFVTEHGAAMAIFFSQTCLIDDGVFH
jgi:hypothetical protein